MNNQTYFKLYRMEDGSWDVVELRPQDEVFYNPQRMFYLTYETYADASIDALQMNVAFDAFPVSY